MLRPKLLPLLALLYTTTPALLAQAADAAAAKTGIIDWGSELAKGGATIWALFALLTVGVAFILERAFHCRDRYIAPAALFRRVKELGAAGDWNGILALTRKDPSALAQIVGFLLQTRLSDFTHASTAAADLGSQEIQQHQQKNYLLMVVATASPLLGLLGTIIGMIESFQTVALAGSMGDASILADSISKALVTTAVGLLVAIPFLLAYHFFRYQTSRRAIRLEKQVTELLYLWFNHPAEPEPAAAAPDTAAE